MRLNGTSTPAWALTVAAALHACCGCSTLLTSQTATSALNPAVDQGDPPATSPDVAVAPPDEESGPPRDTADPWRRPWAELLGEVHRFVAFGDPKEMSSSQFDAVSDRQMKAMRAEIDGGSAPR